MSNDYFAFKLRKEHDFYFKKVPDKILEKGKLYSLHGILAYLGRQRSADLKQSRI